MRKLYIMCFTLIILLSTAMSVQALESKTIERHNGASASATWTDMNGDIEGRDTILSVTKTNDGTDIYLNIYSWGPDYWYEESGYVFTQDDVFEVDNKLNSASLSDVEIDMYNSETGEMMGTLTIRADWIGQGDVSKGSSTYSSRNGDYIWKSSDSSKSRDASATGSINGYDLGISSYAGLYSFKSAYMSMEKRSIL